MGHGSISDAHALSFMLSSVDTHCLLKLIPFTVLPLVKCYLPYFLGGSCLWLLVGYFFGNDMMQNAMLRRK